MILSRKTHGYVMPLKVYRMRKAINNLEKHRLAKIAAEKGIRKWTKKVKYYLKTQK